MTGVAAGLSILLVRRFGLFGAATALFGSGCVACVCNAVVLRAAIKKVKQC
jgi:O-antigen/teichoic acid export membrane protein